LSATYDPPAYDPFEQTTDTQIPGATVTIRDGSLLQSFRDTIVERTDKSRYSDNVSSYVLEPFTPLRSHTYLLEIAVPDGRTVTATMTTPGNSLIYIINPYILVQPSLVEDNISVTGSVTAVTRGILFRCFVEYEAVVGGVLTVFRTEVPSAIGYPNESNPDGFIYPTVTRRRSDPGASGTGVESAMFGHNAYVAILSKINQTYGPSGLRFRSAIVVFTQVDINLYNYYFIANGFRDPVSIRTDEPDFTNIPSGVGVFGSFVNDSVFVDLPDVIDL
jgi:hypothetical protein